MSANITNQVAYLRTSRSFPTDPQALSVEISKSYLDIANSVNSRVIGLFPTNRSAIGGESWFLTGNRRQQNLRQVYLFTGAGNIPHAITNFSSISPKSYGTFTDGTNYYGAIYGSDTAIAGQVSFYVTSTNIVVLAGSGAPSITSGYIVIEWLSQP